jgi:ketosteroid isomerase-like protein
MLKKSALFICLTCTLALTCFAQNTNTSTPPSPTRRRTLTINNNTKPSGTQEQGAAQPQDETSNQTRSSRRSRNQQTGANAPGAKGVLAAFEDLLNGIRNADVEAVTAAYWNSPQLILFNNNGTVTKGWEQMRKNRESSYPEMKDVKLDVRDLRVQMLGRDGALLSCLWTQSQTFRGQSETATGRMTLVFRRVGNAWRAIHLHTSPDAPDPSRVLPSEQTQTPAQKRGQ